MLGLDYAGSSPGAAAVKEAGFTFVARYLSRYASKTIKKPEYDDMTGNGVGVVLVFEDYADQALKGYNQGVADAQVALAQANALGWPSSRPIHFAVDFDISDAQKPIAGEYMKGVISVLTLERTGAYGGYWWIKYCADNNLAAPNARWQAVAWSGGNIHPTATLFQQLGGTVVNGTSCDINKSLKEDFGQGGIDMSKFTKEQEMTAALMATGSIPGDNYNYPFTVEEITSDSLDKFLQTWQSRVSTVTAEMEQTIAKIATGSPYGKDYNSQFQGKPILQALPGMLEFWLSQRSSSTPLTPYSGPQLYVKGK